VWKAPKELDLNDALHKRFAETLKVYEALLPSGRANRTRGMLKRGKSVEQMLSDWALNPKTEGFHTLVEHGMPEHTGEAIILEIPERFSPMVVFAARAKVTARATGTKPNFKSRRGRGSY
jgi:hypothetical protein